MLPNWNLSSLSPDADSQMYDFQDTLILRNLAASSGVRNADAFSVNKTTVSEVIANVTYNHFYTHTLT
jgi:hypothetical protein